MDNDGDIDILYGGITEKVSWLQNNGSNGFAIIRINTGSPPYYGGAIIAADFDKTDSTLEVVMLDTYRFSYYGMSLYYYPNHLSSSVKIKIKSNVSIQERTLFPADINSDGHIDFLLADAHQGKVTWFQNEGNGFDNTPIARDIDTNFTVVTSVFAIDMDRDGDTDVIASGRHEIRWYENDGSQNFTQHRIDYHAYAYFNTVRAADIDNDGNIDIVAGTSPPWSKSIGDIVWYKLDLTNNTVTEHTVAAATTFGYVPNLKLADINQDGNIDIVAVAYDRIAWFENQDSGTKFTSHVIEKGFNFGRPASVAVANFTGDEQLDIAVGLQGTQKDISIYTNTTPPLQIHY